MQISHDGFSRTSFHKKTVFVSILRCNFCGNLKKTKTGRKYLLKYWYQHDDKTFRKNRYFRIYSAL